MGTVIKAICGILIAVILSQVLAKKEKNFSLLLIILACCMVMTSAMVFIAPVLEFFERLQALGQLNNDLIKIVLKATGIGVLTEMTAMICTDMGNASMGKSLQLLATAAILWLSIPLFEELLQIVDSILEAI